MKLNDLISSFTIALSNEENSLLDRMDTVSPLTSFTERERFVIENLIRKSMVSKIARGNSIMVVKNDRPKTS